MRYIGKATVMAIPFRRRAVSRESRKPSTGGIGREQRGNINSRPRGRQSVVARNTLASRARDAAGSRPFPAGLGRSRSPTLSRVVSPRRAIETGVCRARARGNSYGQRENVTVFEWSRIRIVSGKRQVRAVAPLSKRGEKQEVFVISLE